MSEIVRDVLRQEMTVLGNKIDTLGQERDKHATMLGRTEKQIEDCRTKHAELDRHLAGMDQPLPALQPGATVPQKPDVSTKATKAK